MATILEIRDGDPYWWNSPDIWVVPGTNPSGVPGQPIAGEPAYLWARVQNHGKENISGAEVNFYWSNPATGVLRSNSTLIGSGFVDLAPGETKEVLCIIPWIPEIVNDGHECVVAEIIHPSDPLPIPLADEFDPPTYQQIAQKNINVLEVTRSMMIMAIQVAAPPRKQKSLILTMETGGKLENTVLKQLGLNNYKPTKYSIKACLSLERDCEFPKNAKIEKELKLSLKPATAKAVYLKIRPSTNIPKGTYTLLHVISRNENKIEGGITYVLINNEEK